MKSKTHFILYTLILITILFTTNCSYNNHKFRKCLESTEIVSIFEEQLTDLYNNKISLNLLSENFQNWSAKEDFHALKKCMFENKKEKYQFSNGILTKIGETILYATNCEKDVGPALIILDMALSNLKNIKNEWKNLIVNGLSLAFVGYQSFKDCREALESIKDIWSESNLKFLN